MLRTIIALLLVGLFLSTGSPIFGQVNITDGTSSYFWDPGAPQSTNFVDQTAGDIVFEDMWIVRFTENGLFGPEEFTLQLDDNTTSAGVQFLGTDNSLGNTAISTWNVNSSGGFGGPVTLFTVELTQTVSTSASGVAELSHNFSISNFLDGDELDDGADLDIFLFNDFDIPTFSDNSATQLELMNGRLIDMESADGFFANTIGENATNFQFRAVGNGTRLSTAVLNGDIVDLDNSGSPLLNTDINSMFQWDTTVQVGGTVSFAVHTAATLAIPEPAMTGLMGLAGVALVFRRRR